MLAGRTTRTPRKAASRFDAQAFLSSSQLASPVGPFARGDTIYRQGDACEGVFYIRSGSVKLSVISKAAREAVVAVLGPGDFFGEACLAGQALRTGSATAVTPSVIMLVGKAKMEDLLHKQPAMAERFIAHMLSRNIRIEEDLIDQLFNSSEKRLARTLLLLARYGSNEEPVRALPRISQETLAKMIGATRSRVNFFLNKFKKLGFIDYDGQRPVRINSSLLSVVLRD